MPVNGHMTWLFLSVSYLRPETIKSEGKTESVDGIHPKLGCSLILDL